MNKNLLLSSLFLFQICAASDISVESQAEGTALQCSEIASNADIIATECENENNSENSPSSTEIEYQAATSEFSPMSLVFDFVMELDSLNDAWSNLINSVKELNTRCDNQDADNSTEALKLVQAIHNYATSAENNVHGSISSSLSEVTSSELNASSESKAPHHIAIRLVFTQENNNNPELWIAMQAIIPALQESLEDLEDQEELAKEEQESQASEAVEKENFMSIITNAVNQLIAFVHADNNNSVSQTVIITASTNNAAE